MNYNKEDLEKALEGEVSLPQLTVIVKEFFNLRLREAEEVARKIKEVKDAAKG